MGWNVIFDKILCGIILNIFVFIICFLGCFRYCIFDCYGYGKRRFIKGESDNKDMVGWFKRINS